MTCVCRTLRKLLVYLLHTFVINQDHQHRGFNGEMLSHSIKWSGTCMRIPFYGFIYVSYSEMLGNDRLFRLNLATKFMAVGLGMCRDLALFG